MGRKRQAERESGKGARAWAKGAPGGLEPKRRCTPEERRAAVEAYEKSGLTQGAFARQWGVSPMAISIWVRKHAKDGPPGLERLAEGPPKRRGKKPLSYEIVAKDSGVCVRSPTA